MTAMDRNWALDKAKGLLIGSVPTPSRIREAVTTVAAQYEVSPVDQRWLQTALAESVGVPEMQRGTGTGSGRVLGLPRRGKGE